jgi:hypothetical protein
MSKILRSIDFAQLIAYKMEEDGTNLLGIQRHRKAEIANFQRPRFAN